MRFQTVRKITAVFKHFMRQYYVTSENYEPTIPVAISGPETRFFYIFFKGDFGVYSLELQM